MGEQEEGEKPLLRKTKLLLQTDFFILTITALPYNMIQNKGLVTAAVPLNWL